MFKKFRFISILLVFSMLFASLPAHAAASVAEPGHVVVSIEAFTIGGGYLVEPVSVEFYEGEHAVDVLLRVLENHELSYNAPNYSGLFYLASLSGERVDAMPRDTSLVPEVLLTALNQNGFDLGTRDGNTLGEFDYTRGSGWMYCVNNDFPMYGFDFYELHDGDVMRVQYTLAYGMDIGGGSAVCVGPDFYQTPNKDEMTVFLANYFAEHGTIPSYYLNAVSRLDGETLTMPEMYTEEEVYTLAAHYMGWYEDGSYAILRERVPLYDDSNTLFAYAIPFEDSTGTRCGHINIGAWNDGLAFYIIDPVLGDYTNIKRCADNGQKVKYEAPFIYYIDGPESFSESSASGGSESDPQEVPFTQDPDFFNEENAQHNKKLLEYIAAQQSGAIPRAAPMAVPTVAGLNQELNSGAYVKIKGNEIYYGGNQGWFNSADFVSKTEGVTGKIISDFGCGLVALTDNILYYITKGGQAYAALLRYTDETRMILDPSGMSVFNPEYKLSNFDHRFSFDTDTLTMEKSEYLDFLDFYSDMGGGPRLYGMLDRDVKYTYDVLSEITNFTYTRSTPESQGIEDVENFITAKLNNDVPVLLNNVKLAAKKYMQNDQSWCTHEWEGMEDQNFGRHWMTVTKYFKNNDTGDTFVAFSSWGIRFSINVKLLQDKNKYYSKFYTYELRPKA